MHRLLKKAFRPGRLMIASGLLFFLIFLSTQKVQAVTNDNYPYLIKVNRLQNTITVYSRDENGGYNIPYKAFVCSVGQKGTETILGTFRTKEKYRWKALMGDVWGQYSTRIVGGILFHSVYYYENGNPATLANREYNKLGSAASHGCIRLTVEAAKWIYDNCPVGTTVIIYDDKSSPGPLGKPEAIKLPSAVRWDPTDPSGNNPYKNRKPVIYGVKNYSIPWGDEIDLKKGITAKSTVGLEITTKLMVDGSINIYKSGHYKVTYSVIDALGRSTSKTATVTVEDSPIIPVFEGIHDRYVKAAGEITRDSALSGVMAFRDDVPVDDQDIEVTIETVSQNEYQVTYSVLSGDTLLISESAYFYVDIEAPVFSGIGDRILEQGQVPDQLYALKDVTVTDNYTVIKQEDIKVTIEEILGEYPGEGASDPAGTPSRENNTSETVPSTDLPKDMSSDANTKYYSITYEAQDEPGNTAIKTVYFHY
jgi:hypothetical protein